jgi:hypothetical protein
VPSGRGSRRKRAWEIKDTSAILSALIRVIRVIRGKKTPAISFHLKNIFNRG